MIKLAFCLMSAAGLAGEEGTLPLLPPLQPLPQPPLPLLPLPLPTHAEAGAGVGLLGGSSSLTSHESNRPMKMSRSIDNNPYQVVVVKIYSRVVIITKRLTIWMTSPLFEKLRVSLERIQKKPDDV
jgi:hypothetical protein